MRLSLQRGAVTERGRQGRAALVGLGAATRLHEVHLGMHAHAVVHELRFQQPLEPPYGTRRVLPRHGDTLSEEFNHLACVSPLLAEAAASEM